MRPDPVVAQLRLRLSYLAAVWTGSLMWQDIAGRIEPLLEFSVGTIPGTQVKGSDPTGSRGFMCAVSAPRHMPVTRLCFRVCYGLPRGRRIGQPLGPLPPCLAGPSPIAGREAQGAPCRGGLVGRALADHAP